MYILLSLRTKQRDHQYSVTFNDNDVEMHYSVFNKSVLERGRFFICAATYVSGPQDH
jgi:hypothetical protein